MFAHARLKDFAPDEGVRVGAFEERFEEEGWIPVPIPGDVHTALLDAGRIDDPFYDRNENRCAWIDFEGEIIWEEDIRVRVPANASLTVARWSPDRASGAPDRYLSVSSARDRFPANRHFFAAIKDLRRTPVEPDVDIISTGEYELRVRLKASTYAYFVHLDIPDAATRFSDNYSDLEPGEGRTIFVTNEERSITPRMSSVRWR